MLCDFESIWVKLEEIIIYYQILSNKWKLYFSLGHGSTLSQHGSPHTKCIVISHHGSPRSPRQPTLSESQRISKTKVSNPDFTGKWKLKEYIGNEDYLKSEGWNWIDGCFGGIGGTEPVSTKRNGHFQWIYCWTTSQRIGSLSVTPCYSVSCSSRSAVLWLKYFTAKVMAQSVHSLLINSRCLQIE